MPMIRYRPALLALLTAGLASLAQAADVSPVAGEIRKVDLATRKLTIRHGDIPNLDMPPMTMVFQADPRVDLSGLKPGDAVRFKATRSAGGALVASEVEPVPR